MSVVLSIDVGIIHFAYCLYNIKEQLILKWECFSILSNEDKTKTKRKFFSLIKTLQDLLKALKLRNDIFQQANVILIEKQPRCNVKMQKISTAICTYFLLECPNSKVKEYSSKHKLNKLEDHDKIVCVEQLEKIAKIKSAYSRRKKLSILYCLHIIQSSSGNKEWVYYFNQSSKKDDLADCFLQAKSFCV